MAESVLTSYGEQLITNAIASSSTINITSFIVSSDIVTLNPSLTTLPNIVMTSSEPSRFSVVKVANDTVEFRIYLNTTDGDFDIGTIGILDDSNQLVAAGNLDEIIHKKRTTETQQGNTLQFKIPINLDDASQVVTSINQQFIVDNSTILIDSDGVISCGVVPHHVFDIFQNASTANPPGALPLWTGEVVYCRGAHEEFYEKAVEAAANNNIRSITTSTYNSEVSSRGWTNGFVINSSAMSIRLPKFKGVLYLNDPSVSTTTSASITTNNTTGFITLPTYIQVDTAAVPATVAQCNAFTESLEDFASQFVTLSTDQTITGHKTFQVGYNGVILKNTTANSYSDLSYMDNSGNLIGRIRGGVNSSNQKYAVLFYDVDYVTTKQPTDDTNNSSQIDTVGARNTKLTNYVTLATTQNITGEKTFATRVTTNNAVSAPIRCIISNVDYNTTTTVNNYMGFWDKNTKFISGIQSRKVDTGESLTKLMVRKQGDVTTADSSLPYIGIGYDSNGKLFSHVPNVTLSSSDSNYGLQIVNVNYLNGSSSNVVHRTGNGTIAGTKTFSSTISGSINGNAATVTNGVYTNNSQTITGQKTFTKNIIQTINCKRTVTPSSDEYQGIGIHDTDNNMFVSFLASKYGSSSEIAGASSAFMRVFNPSNTNNDATYLSLVYKTNGSKYATAPASDINGSIVTTAAKGKYADRGYYELGNGLIIQWGASSASDRKVNFRKTFPTTCQVVGNCNYGGSTGDGHGYVYNISTSGFEFRGVDGDMLPFHWIAIGY